MAVTQEAGDGENWLESTHMSKVELPGLDVGGGKGRRKTAKVFGPSNCKDEMLVY